MEEPVAKDPVVEAAPAPAEPPPQTPAILVGWDAGSQGVLLKFDNAEFRSWDFVVGVLEMAVSKARDMQRAAQLDAMQKQAQNALVMQQLQGR